MSEITDENTQLRIQDSENASSSSDDASPLNFPDSNLDSSPVPSSHESS